MVGLHYLKHAFNESDETVVERWVENPYWQHFCGEEYFRHEMPIDPSQMTRFRDRIGEDGCEFMLGVTVRTGLETGTVRRASLAVVKCRHYRTRQSHCISHRCQALSQSPGFTGQNGPRHWH